MNPRKSCYKMRKQFLIYAHRRRNVPNLTKSQLQQLKRWKKQFVNDEMGASGLTWKSLKCTRNE